MNFFRQWKDSGRLVGASLVVLGLAVGFTGGYAQGKANETNLIKSSFSPIKESGTSYTFVHPLLAYRTPEATELGEYASLKNAFQTKVNLATQSGASRVSVYFRDLEAGQWVGINQEDTYYPASLLKVPTMIAYYKEAEGNPYLLSDTISYDPRVMPEASFDAPSTLVAWRPYSIKELIKSMIVDSDNGATFTLLNRINSNYLHAVYVALGVPDPGDNSADYQISARTYALFFRVLYNGSYLSSNSSEQALKLLSQTTFRDGLDAGVPQGTVIAHKYGEHVLTQSGVASGVELSDCGIVYYPAHPYLLCVMASAPSEASAEKIIADISRAAYTATQQQYGDK